MKLMLDILPIIYKLDSKYNKLLEAPSIHIYKTTFLFLKIGCCQPHIRWSLGNPENRKRKDCRSQKGQGHQKKTQNQLTWTYGAHRD